MQTPQERFSVFMKSLIKDRLLPDHMFKGQASMNIDSATFDEYIIMQISGLSEKHLVFLDVDGLGVSSKYRTSSYVTWDKAKFVIPFNYDQLVEEFVECGVEVDDTYLLEYGEQERSAAALEIRQNHSKGCLGYIVVTFFIAIYFNHNILEDIFNHWILSIIFVFFAFKGMFPDIKKYEEDNKGKIYVLARKMMLNRIGERRNSLSIKSLRFKAILGPDMMDTRLLREIIAYGCKARERMDDMLYGE